MLTLLAAVLVMQCMSLDELSGTFNTALSAGVETCWTLTCVGRLELAYNPSFEGKFVVNNGTETALRTDAHYNTVTFNAHWDVTLTAAVDACAGGNCSSSVEFSWGCGMDAPALEVAAVSTADTSSQASAIVTPDFMFSYYYTPLVHTISCVGTLEMNYRLFYVGNFSVNSAAAQVFYTTAYGPHFGTSRFTADGDVSFLAQGRMCYRGGCGGFQYSWGCNMPAPELENTNPAPFNFTPSCPTTTTLGTSGSISTEVDGTECWELACEGGSVGITFTEINTTAGVRYVNVYEMDGDRVVGFPFHESGEKQGVSLTSAASSVLVQYRSDYGPLENNSLAFDYICMAGGATAGPTALPLGPSATPTPTTSAPITPITPITPTPTSAGPCTPFGALSGTFNTALSAGVETCWTLTCVGRLELAYNPSFEGKFVVNNGTETALRTDAHYNTVTFNAHWDVTLTAAVDACAGGNCSSSVEFSWGCGMDAPALEVAAVSTADTSSQASAIVTPDFMFSYYYTPLVHTISCVGTLEMNYRLFYVGNFSVNSAAAQVFYTTAYGPHFGTSRFTADGDVSFLAQGRMCYRGGCGGFQYSWGCNMPAPELENTNPAPFNFTPSCPTTTTLGTSGSISTEVDGTECWELACEGGSVGITFTEINTTAGVRYVNVYEMDGDRVVGFPFHESGEKQGVSLTSAASSVLVQYRSDYGPLENNSLAFDYICMAGGATAGPTALPLGPSATPTPTTSAPITPITPITPTPTSAGPCTPFGALSGTFNTALSAGVETCWTLTCVGRLELAYNPSFEGKFVVNNGTETALRTDAHYNTVTFNAHWDVTLTAAVDACAGGNCSSSVEFSWGCGMDAPALEVAAVSTADTSSQASAIVTPDFMFSYYYTPLVHTISCVGTLEMNYRLFYVGNFSVNSAAAQVFYTTAYGPHFGTSRFTADGDVSFLAQGRMCYRGGCGGFQYSWGCNMPAPELENTNPAPFNFTPSCPTTTTLGTSGSISTEVDGTECWELACEGGSVGITFTEINTTAGVRYVNVYEMDGDRVVGFPFHESGEKQGVSLTSAASSVLVQYRSDYGPLENNSLAFDYICMAGGATAGPTALPLGPSATPTPTTSAPITPITPITPTPTSAGPCTPFGALSGTFNTALSAGVETCWTLTCVGRLELAYNPSFEGKFVVNNGTETALRTDAHYNTVTFNAHWDVTLTAAVDACAGGNCSSSVEFSWGCGMDAPALEVAAVSTADTSSQASAIVTPDFMFSYYYTPLVHTISCVGTLEMNYRLFYVGNFSVNSAAAQVFYTTAYGPHFGTSRFTADGDVSFLAQGRMCYRGGCGGFQYSWGCNMPAPELENTNPAPFNFTPSCPTTTTLGTSGSISTEVDGTECWELACEGGSVGITFTEINTTAGVRYVNVYEMDGDRVVGFPFHESGEKQGVSLTSAASSVLVQYRSDYGPLENNSLAFDYICMAGGATAGPTALPLGPSATPTPTTSAPITPITPITPTPTSAGPCTPFGALSGTFNTALSAGVETCWTLTCVGRLELAYNPSFEGKFVVNNGTETALRTDAHYNTVTFNAHWDVTLTAAVDACAGGNCSSSVEFSWGCGMDAPALEVAAVSTADTSSQASAIVTPDFMFSYYYTPLVHTISCVGTLEMNYRLFYVGNFSVNSAAAQVFYTTAYGPHFGTSRFTADGDVSFLAQGRMCYRGGCGGFQYSWGCNMPAPELENTNPAPFNFTPSCPTTTTLGTSGSISTEVDGTECWELACEGGSVGITFTEINTTAGVRYVNVYEMDGDRVVGFPFHESGEKQGVSLTSAASSVLVQYRSDYGPLENNSLAFDYICMAGGATAGPTALPLGPSATPTPTTSTPLGSGTFYRSEVPITSVPVTEVPMSPSRKWCITDVECQKHGDTGARCDRDTFKCTCSSGFENPRHKSRGSVAHVCANSATRTSDVVRVTLDVDCDDGAAKGSRVASMIRRIVQGTVLDVDTLCGSLNVLVHLDNVPLLEVAALDLAEELTSEMAAANDVVGTVLSAGLASMDALECRDVIGAEVVVILGGVCVPLNCADNHILVGRECVLLTPTPQEDDDFPIGAIVGLCLGGGALLLIAAIVAYLLCKKDSPTPIGNNEPVATENKESAV